MFQPLIQIKVYYMVYCRVEKYEMADMNPGDTDNSADMFITDTKVTIDVRSVDEGDVQYSRGERSITRRTTAELTRTDEQEEDCGPHTSVSVEQLTTKGTHRRTVGVGSEELQGDDQHTSESSCVSHVPAILSAEDFEISDPETKGKKGYSAVGNIFEAAQSGNMSMIEEYLDQGLPPDLVDEEGWSILHHAASHGQVEVIKLLHSRGCSVDAVDRHGRTPLHHATTSGECGSISVLVELGSNVNHVDNEGNTPLKCSLMLCERYAAMEELLKYGGVENVDCLPQLQQHFLQEPNTSSASDTLHIDTLSRRIEVKVDGQFRTSVSFEHLAGESILGGKTCVGRKLLIKDSGFMSTYSCVSEGTEILDTENCKGVESRNGGCLVVGDIFKAAGSGNMAMIRNYLDVGVSPDFIDEVGWSILHHAASHGQVEVIELLHSRGCSVDPVDRHGRTPLHHAAASGECVSIGVLVELGSNVNSIDTEGNTPLKWSVMCERYAAMEELLKYGGVEDVECSLGSESSDILRKQEFVAAIWKETIVKLLLQFAYTGNVLMMSAIIQRGCPVDAVNSDGINALHYAAAGGAVEVIGVLIERGLDINRMSNDGCTPLHWASGCGKLEAVRELLRLGAKPSMTVVARNYGTPLHQAARGGHKEMVSVLLDAGCPIDVVNSDGRSALHYAAESGAVEVIGVLIERGLDVNREDDDSRTPLHWASACGKLEAVHELLRLGAEELMTVVAGTIATPLHQAAMGGHKEIVSVLLDAGCPIDVVGIKGGSALHYAAGGGAVEVIGVLVERGLDVNREDNDGWTPLHAASSGGKLEAVCELLRLGANASMTVVAGIVGTPLHQAAIKGHKEIVSVLLDAGCPIGVEDSKGCYALHYAAQGGAVEVIGVLVERGLDVNKEDNDGKTPLHLASAHGKLEAVRELLRLGAQASMTMVAGIYGTKPLHQAALKGHKEIVSVLLDAGCPIDVVDNEGRSVLHYTAESGAVEVIGVLIERGLDVNREDNDGRTPLHWTSGLGELEAVCELLRLGAQASMTMVAGKYGTPLHQAALKGHKEIVSVLLDAGCPIDVVDNEGRSVLHYAAESGAVEVIGVLIERGLDVNREDNDGWTPLHWTSGLGELEAVCELLRLGAQASMTMVAGKYGTPLHQAALKGHKEIVSVLLDAGCPIDVVTIKGHSALHVAAGGGAVEVLGVLIERGLDVNQEDNDGQTPLYLASACSKLETVCELLRLGAKVSLVDDKYGRPLFQAIINDHKEIISALLKACHPNDTIIIHYADNTPSTYSVRYEKLLAMATEEKLKYGKSEIADAETEDSEGCSEVGDIFEAAQSGNMAMIEKYLKIGVPPDLVDEEGWSILHHAASHGQVEVMKLLHSRGCSVDPVDRQGRTPLHHAAVSGECGAIGVLVELGSNVNSVDNEGNTPLKCSLVCERYAAMEELLKYGGVEDVECNMGSESSDDLRRQEFVAALDEEALVDLLLQSASIDDVQTVSAILKGGCPVDAVDSAGWTAVHAAASGGHCEMIEELIEKGASVDARSRDGSTPFHLAVYNGYSGAALILLGLGANRFMTMVDSTKHGTKPLHLAALKGHMHIVFVLLCADCPIDVVDFNGSSALHYAAIGGAVEVIGVLIEQGLDANKKNNDGGTPLHIASACGKLEAVHELLRLGAKASMTVVAGKDGTPLHQAALKGHKEIVSVLLDAGCPIDVVNSGGCSALHYAAGCGAVEVIGVLVERGLDVNREDNDGWTPLHAASSGGKLEAVCELLRLGANASISVVAGNHGTPLHQAALKGLKEIVSVLLDAGCPIDVLDSDGAKVIHHTAVVCAVGVKEVMPEEVFSSEAYQPAGNEKKQDIFITKMGHGITTSKNPLDCYTPDGYTPAMLAAMVGSVEVLELLVSKHCDISIRSSFDLSILEHAIMAGQMNKLIDMSKVCGVHAENTSLRTLLSALQERKLLDPSKLLIFGSFAGDPLVIDTLSSEESTLSEAACQRWTTTRQLILDDYQNVDYKLKEAFYDQLGLPNECPLSPLHIALILLKYKTEYGHEIEGNLATFHTSPEDSELYINSLISHPLTKFSVTELFPNGLSPLDVARQFNFHDIACMIERAGGGPGMWADLPKEIKEKGIRNLVSLQDLLSHDVGGQEAASRIISHLFGGLSSVTSAEDDAREKILLSKPELRHIVKHVLSRLHHLDCWFDVGVLLGVEEDELLTIQSDSKQDRVAYRTMLSTWLKHGRHVTWQNLFDALWDYEPGRIVEEMKKNIIEELTQSQVRT